MLAGQEQAWRQTPRGSTLQSCSSFGSNVTVLKILPGDDSGLCLNLSVLNVDFVATQHNGDVLTLVPDLYAS